MKKTYSRPLYQMPFLIRWRPGKGVFPLYALFSCVKSFEYSGAICLEWERKWHGYLPELSHVLSLLC